MANETALIDGGPTVEAADLPALVGWSIEEKGLCRGDECVPVPRGSLAEQDGAIDVTEVAALLDRPCVVDEESGLVAIGLPRDRRRAALTDLRAADFSLPDLDGTPVSFADHRSKKRLLVAFSSW